MGLVHPKIWGQFIFLLLFSSWGSLGTCIFIIITSWFTCEKDGIHSKKVFYLIFQTFFISIFFSIIAKYFLQLPISRSCLFYEICSPFLQEQYWFITAYIIFYLALPILQMIVKYANKSQYNYFILFLTVIITLNKFNHVIILGTLGDFIYLFFVTAWLKKYPQNFIEKNACKCALIMIVAISSVLICFQYVGVFYSKAYFFSLIMSFIGKWLPIYFLSFCIFYIFKNYLVIYSSFINRIAKTMLGVYLLHENLILRGYNGCNSFLWHDICKLNDSFSSVFFPLIYISKVLAVFGICIFLELIREVIIDKLLLDKIKFWNSIFDKIDRKVLSKNEHKNIN